MNDNADGVSSGEESDMPSDDRWSDKMRNDRWNDKCKVLTVTMSDIRTSSEHK